MRIRRGVTLAFWLALALAVGGTLFIRLNERSQLQSPRSRWSSGLASLRVSDPDARRTAAQRLNALVHENRNAIPGWSSFDPTTRADFQHLIGLIANPEEDPRTREILVAVAANQGFRELPDPILSTLAHVLQDESEPTRLRCAIARHAVPAAGREPIRNAVLATLTSKDDAVRHLAYLTLASLPIDAKTLVPLLNRGLTDLLALIRVQVVHQSQKLAKRGDRAAVGLLLTASKDQDETVRNVALRAIEHLDPAPAEAVPDLIAALDDAGPGLRIALASGLLRTTGQVENFAPILIDGLRSDDMDAWQAASTALWRIGRHSEMKPKVLQELTLSMLDKTDQRFRIRVGLTLAMAAGPSNVYKPFISQGLQSNDQGLRNWALMASAMNQMRTQPGPQTGPTRLIVQRGLVLLAVAAGLALIGLFIQLALSAGKTRRRPPVPVAQEPATAPSPGDPGRIFIWNYPRRVKLQPVAEPSWSDPAEINARIEALHGLGFSDVGSFEIAELPGVRLRGLVNPLQAAVADVVDHLEWGRFLVLKTVYQDGTSYRQTSTHRLDRPDQRPGHDVVYVEPTDVPMRLARFVAERPDRPMRMVAPDEYVAEFEHDHADMVDWRLTRGLMSDREIRDLNRVKGNEVSDDQVADVRRQLAEKATNELDKSLRERFLLSRPWSLEERAKLGPSLVIVHDALPIERVWEWFPTLIDDEFHADQRARESALYDDSIDGEPAPDQPPAWQTLPPRLSFVALNERARPEDRFEKLGSLAWPVEADVYLMKSEPVPA